MAFIRRIRRSESALLYALLAGFVAIVCLWPLGRLLVEGLMTGGEPSLGPLARVLDAPATWRAVYNSLTVAGAGTALAVLIGATTALIVGLTDIRAKPALVLCLILPLMIAPQVTALAWLQVLGPSSALLQAIGLAPPPGTRNPLYSEGGIMLLFGIQHAPLVFLALRAGLRRVPSDLVEAAHAAGAGRWQAVATVVLPLLAPSLIAGTALAFVSAIGNFGIPALLGIPGRYTVLTTLIYQRLAGLGPAALSESAALSLVLGAIAVGGLGVQGWMNRRAHGRASAVTGPKPYALRAWRLPVELLCWGIVLFVLIMPMSALVATSITGAMGVKLTAETATLANYAFVLFDHAVTPRAFRNSFLLAGGAAVLLAVVAVPLAYFIVWREARMLRLLAVAAECTYALPGVVLAIAAILIFLKPLPVLGWSLYGTVWIILMAYLSRFLTLALKPVIAGMQQSERAYEEAAVILGAGLLTRLVTVVVPLVAPAAAAGGLLVFLTAFNELTVSALLWSTGAETLGVVVFSLEQSGESTLAAAIAVLTVLATVGLMLVASAFQGRLPPGTLPWQA
jgi:iron(III) transport system permease protein